jgi:hypothetical protein
MADIAGRLGCVGKVDDRPKQGRRSELDSTEVAFATFLTSINVITDSGDVMSKMQVPSATLRTGSSTAPLAMKLQETSLRMTLSISIHHLLNLYVDTA